VITTPEHDLFLFYDFNQLLTSFSHFYLFSNVHYRRIALHQYDPSSSVCQTHSIEEEMTPKIHRVSGVFGQEATTTTMTTTTLQPSEVESAIHPVGFNIFTSSKSCIPSIATTTTTTTTALSHNESQEKRKSRISFVDDSDDDEEEGDGTHLQPTSRVSKGIYYWPYPNEAKDMKEEEEEEDLPLVDYTVSDDDNA
jgi:hypothetical protein